MKAPRVKRYVGAIYGVKSPPKCVTCHGPEGKGDGPVGKALKPPAGDFSSTESKKKSADELRAIIENGKPKTAMVAWGKQLNETEVQDVLAYVLTLRK